MNVETAKNYKMTYERGAWGENRHIVHKTLNLMHSDHAKNSKNIDFNRALQHPEFVAKLVHSHPEHKDMKKRGYNVHTYGSHSKPLFGKVVKEEKPFVSDVTLGVQKELLKTAYEILSGKTVKEDDAGGDVDNSNSVVVNPALNNTANVDEKPAVLNGLKNAVIKRNDKYIASNSTGAEKEFDNLEDAIAYAGLSKLVSEVSSNLMSNYMKKAVDRVDVASSVAGLKAAKGDYEGAKAAGTEVSRRKRGLEMARNKLIKMATAKEENELFTAEEIEKIKEILKD